MCVICDKCYEGSGITPKMEKISDNYDVFSQLGYKTYTCWICGNYQFEAD